MISIWINQELGLSRIDNSEKATWTDVRNATRDDLQLLEKEYDIYPEHLLDIMDVDEQARIEREENYTILIIRLPVHDPERQVAYHTVPVGVILFSDRVVTICQSDSEVLEELVGGGRRTLDLKNLNAFILKLFGKAAIIYLRYLKDLNRRTAAIENELQRSVKNVELIKLLDIEKSLVYFTAALKSNEILFESLTKSRILRLKEDEEELFEDVETDNKQALQMVGVHADIVQKLMEGFTSVISNNLNNVMKRLTIISIVLMIPTLITSAFGMNIPLPLATESNALLYISGMCLASGLVGALVLTSRSVKSRIKTGKSGKKSFPMQNNSIHL